jgi:Cyclin, N-terminal domain
MNFADQLDMRDPQFVTEYANDIFENLRKEEEGM